MMLFNKISWENTDKNKTLNLITQSSNVDLCDPDNVPFTINALMLLMSYVGGKEKLELCVCVCVGGCLTHPYAVYISIYSKDTLMTSTTSIHLHHLMHRTKTMRSESQPFFSIWKNTKSSVLRPLNNYSGIGEQNWSSESFRSLLFSYLSETEMVSPAWRTAGVPNSKTLSVGKFAHLQN